MRKPDFCICETKMQISFAVTAKLISAFVFATWIVQFLFYLNPKFQASGYLLWLYSPVCVGPGRKPRRPVFSERGSFCNCYIDSVQPSGFQTRRSWVLIPALSIFFFFLKYIESVLGSNIAPPLPPHFFIIFILYNTFLYIVQYLLFLVHIPHTPHHPYPQHCVHIHPDPAPTRPPFHLTPSPPDPPPPIFFL